MKEINLFELFAGIGSPRAALRNADIPYKSLGYSEIDPHAIKSYCAIYDDDESNNYGDISQIDKLPDGVDLLVHGSPCQDFSLAGKQAGGDQDSGTRSSLMWETVRLLSDSRPDVVLWENVKSVLNKKHINNFDKYLETLSDLGYENSHKVLSGTQFSVPQSRERVFVVSSLIGKFDFDDLTEAELRSLEEFVYFRNHETVEVQINQAVKDGYTRAETPCVFNGSFPNSKTRRGRVIANGKVSPTILTGSELLAVELSDNMKRYITAFDKTGKFQVSKKMIINPDPIPTISTREGQTRIASSTYISEDFKKNENVCGVDLTKFNVRKLTTLESWKLMGFTEEDHNKAAQVCSKTQLYKQAGNSIIVPILEAIFRRLYAKKDENIEGGC